jgi:O-antigen/teichoic acid export membrane protein
VGLWVYLGTLLGIVFLMTTKPPLVDAIFAIVIATALGLVAGLLLWWAAGARSRMKVTGSEAHQDLSRRSPYDVQRLIRRRIIPS